MYIAPEIITIFFIVSFLIYTMPMVLVKFSKTLKGRFLLVMLMIVVTLYNKTGGLMIALLIIFLSEFNYEINNQIIFEGFDNNTIVENTTDDKLTTEEKLKPKKASSERVINVENDNNGSNDSNGNNGNNGNN
jgi:hypothetical protein